MTLAGVWLDPLLTARQRVEGQETAGEEDHQGCHRHNRTEGGDATNAHNQWLCGPGLTVVTKGVTVLCNVTGEVALPTSRHLTLVANMDQKLAKMKKGRDRLKQNHAIHSSSIVQRRIILVLATASKLHRTEGCETHVKGSIRKLIRSTKNSDINKTGGTRRHRSTRVVETRHQRWNPKKGITVVLLRKSDTHLMRRSPLYAANSSCRDLAGLQVNKKVL